MIQTLEQDRAWFEQDLLNRFLRYVKIHTTSDPHENSTPSTKGQWELARILEEELRMMGLPFVELTKHCNLIARIPANTNTERPGLMFLAHLDTTPDFNGREARPRLHQNYDGGIIEFANRPNLDPIHDQHLSRYRGDTIITTDGTSLLGADDKAGIAEIMTAIRYLIKNPDIPRGEVEVIFTPDEEIGRGTLCFPTDRVHASHGFTLDGEHEGSYNARCFNAYAAEVRFTGLMVHPGRARGRFVNAISMASQYHSMLPRNESPEATDGDYGYYNSVELSGTMESCRLNLIIRDFDSGGMERRMEYLRQLTRTVELAFPGGSARISFSKQYLNLMNFLTNTPELVSILETSIRDTGIEPVHESIRGGTDGAQLSEKGYPTPNIFTGAHNVHGPQEWIALSAMVRASKVVLNIVQHWAHED